MLLRNKSESRWVFVDGVLSFSNYHTMVWLPRARSHSNRAPLFVQINTNKLMLLRKHALRCAHNNKLKSKARLLKVSSHTPLCNVFIYQWARNINERRFLFCAECAGWQWQRQPTRTTRKFFGADRIQLACVRGPFWNNLPDNSGVAAVHESNYCIIESAYVHLCAFRSTWTIAISQ